MNKTRAETLNQLIWHTRRLFQRLRATSEELLEDTGVNTSQRAVLEFLHQQPPRTVPQIAREHSVSRQHIQTIVNDLLQLGLIESIENPAHKRSQLIRLTEAGDGMFASIQTSEAALLSAIAKKFSQEEVVTSIQTLKAIDDYLSGQQTKI